MKAHQWPRSHYFWHQAQTGSSGSLPAPSTRLASLRSEFTTLGPVLDFAPGFFWVHRLLPDTSTPGRCFFQSGLWSRR